MKPLSELSKEELLALAEQKDAEIKAKEAELAQKEADLASAAQVVDKLKTQVAEKKDLQGPKTRVKVGNKTYEFPSEKFTLPNHSHGTDLTDLEAKKIAESPKEYAEVLEALVKSGFLIEVKATK